MWETSGGRLFTLFRSEEKLARVGLVWSRTRDSSVAGCRYLLKIVTYAGVLANSLSFAVYSSPLSQIPPFPLSRLMLDLDCRIVSTDGRIRTSFAQEP